MRLSWMLLILLVVITTVLAKERPQKRINRGEGNLIERKRGARNQVVNTAKVTLKDDPEDYDSVELMHQGQNAETENQNLCSNQKCSRGEMCASDEGKGHCVCQTCDNELTADYKVCSTKNVTYDSECDIDRDHCLCRSKQPGCKDSNVDKVRLDYYGECREFNECPKDELENFPSRMRDWLFRVMRELASRHELDEYLDLLESAVYDDLHADAVIWKFCDLDIHPEDRKITRPELMFITASIKSKEHCLVPFLASCDTDKDSEISLVEWGTCLGIGHGVIEDKCKQVHKLRG